MKANEKFKKLCNNYAQNQGRAAVVVSFAKSCQKFAMDMELRYCKMPEDRVANRITEHIAENNIYKIRTYMAQMEKYLKEIEETFICIKEDSTDEKNP